MVGVPVTEPVALRVKPGGNPETGAKTYVPSPPVALNAALYGAPTTPPGNVPGVKSSAGGPIAITSVFGAADCVCVDALNVTPYAPSAVGVPLITPVEGFSAKPGGNPVADHTGAVTNPLLVNVAEYGTCVLPAGSDAVVMSPLGSVIVT